eukprot:TRINITY_DN68004_c1_g6_i1.p1 TRINITY_DN68004_c1_g6~~TRINITY_DN68004_c1_g6_i1.p1  ORF type:complete len:400 (-),score=34.04 TRINITY_DN68004_c1_g6_i1:86-1285(-)
MKRSCNDDKNAPPHKKEKTASNEGGVPAWLTPLTHAAWNGDCAKATQLLQNDPNPQLLVKQCARAGITPLLCAAHAGHIQTIQVLLDHGSSLEETNDDGWTCLLIATANGEFDAMQWLVEQQHCNPQKEMNNGGMTAIHWAAHNGHLDCIKWLLRYNSTLAQLQDDTGWTALLWSCWSGEFATVQWLLQNEYSSVNETSTRGENALMVATQEGHMHVMSYLVSRWGMNLEDAVKWAAIFCQVPTMKYCITKLGWTPEETFAHMDRLMVELRPTVMSCFVQLLQQGWLFVSDIPADWDILALPTKVPEDVVVEEKEKLTELAAHIGTVQQFVKTIGKMQWNGPENHSLFPSVLQSTICFLFWCLRRILPDVIAAQCIKCFTCSGLVPTHSTVQWDWQEGD